MSHDGEGTRPPGTDTTEQTPLISDDVHTCIGPPHPAQSSDFEELSSNRLAVVLSSIWVRSPAKAHSGG